MIPIMRYFDLSIYRWITIPQKDFKASYDYILNIKKN